MFFNRKNKTKNIPNEEIVFKANQMAMAFARLIESPNIIPGLIYDQSLLPDAKFCLTEYCKFWIKICTDADQLNAWKITLPCMAYFQPNIGPVPLGLDVRKISRGPEMAADVLKQKLPSNEILKIVKDEEMDLYNWVCNLINGVK